MLAYLTDERPTTCERASLDVIPVAPTPDDQAAWAQAAYEAAQRLDTPCWVPSRRREGRPPGSSGRPRGC